MFKKSQKPKKDNKISDTDSGSKVVLRKTSIKVLKIVVVLVILVVIAFVAIKVGFGATDEIEFSDDGIVKSDIQISQGILINNAGLTEFANNGTLKLEYSPKSDLFVITDLKSGTILRSYPEPISEILNPEGTDIANYIYPKETAKIVTSPVYVGYTKSGMEGGFVIGVNQFNVVTKTVHYIENGIRLQYEIEDIACEINIEITLDGNAIRYKVPYNGIIERRTYTHEQDDRRPLLTSIAVLPFFGAHRAGDEGAYVIPDGSGAITYFDVARISDNNGLTKLIYGSDYTFADMDSPDYNNLLMPMAVYGILDNNVMLSSYILSGESETTLQMTSPGMKSLPFYTLFYQFNYRYFYKLRISKSGSDYDMVVRNKHLGDVEQIIYVDIKDEAEEGYKDYTYVDLALKTRELLVEKWETKWGVTDKKSNENPATLNIKVLMAAENMFGGLTNTLNVMTSFEEVQEIYNALEEKGINNIKLSLLGWQKGGYYGNITNKYNAESDLGGKGDLMDLVEWTDTKNIELSLDNNMLLLYGSPRKGATLRNSVVKKPNTFYLNYKITTNSGRFRMNTNFYVMSPEYYDSVLLERDLEYLTDYGVSNVDLQQLGSMIYSDYNQENALLRSQAIAMYVDWIKEYQKNFDTVAIYNGNEYAAAVADTIIDIAMDKSTNILLDEQIPFIQIVYHGLLNYYSAPINRMDSERYSVLKSVEYGSLMAYELTKEKSSELQYTYYNTLFKSQYDLLVDDIKSVYDIAQEAVIPFVSQSIVDHYRVAEGVEVYCTVYSGGARVYVNYGSTDYSLEDGKTVGTMNYLVVA